MCLCVLAVILCLRRAFVDTPPPPPPNPRATINTTLCNCQQVLVTGSAAFFTYLVFYSTLGVPAWQIGVANAVVCLLSGASSPIVLELAVRDFDF